MKITIQEKKENKMINRLEVKGVISFHGATPSNHDVISMLAKELGCDASLIVMKNIHNNFSRQEAKFSAVAYKDANTRKTTEKMTSHLKKKLEEEMKKAAEAKKAEA